MEKNDELTKLTLHIILLEIVQKKLNQLDESLNSVAQKEKSAMSKYRGSIKGINPPKRPQGEKLPN